MLIAALMLWALPVWADGPFSKVRPMTTLESIRSFPGFDDLPQAQQQQHEQEAMKEDQEHFRLYAGCQPVYVDVGEFLNDEKQIGLKRATVQRMADAHLLATHLYTTKQEGPLLVVAVTVVGMAFSVALRLHKPFQDIYSRHIDYAGTWTNGLTGVHGGGETGQQYVLDSARTLMERFVGDYLRVNAPACDRLG